MFGFITANISELTPSEKCRYRSIYCGICNRLAVDGSHLCQTALSYDLVFLALVLSSLYEPQECLKDRRCLPHPFTRHAYTDSPVVAYAAHMNLALGYYSAKDHWKDDHRLDKLAVEKILEKHYPLVRSLYGRQCEAIESSLEELDTLERQDCNNPDIPANAFGRLLGELFVWKEDKWAPTLHQLGHHLGRFIYLADAAMDLNRDKKRGRYNPFLSMTSDRSTAFEEILTGELGACADAFECLPLVQDKHLLDNILYSGVWLTYRHKEKKGHRMPHED